MGRVDEIRLGGESKGGSWVVRNGEDRPLIRWRQPKE